MNNNTNSEAGSNCRPTNNKNFTVWRVFIWCFAIVRICFKQILMSFFVIDGNLNRTLEKKKNLNFVWCRDIVLHSTRVSHKLFSSPHPSSNIFQPKIFGRENNFCFHQGPFPKKDRITYILCAHIPWITSMLLSFLWAQLIERKDIYINCAHKFHSQGMLEWIFFSFASILIPDFIGNVIWRFFFWFLQGIIFWQDQTLIENKNEIYVERPNFFSAPSY
jgi:hypothetical protein